MNQSHWAEFLSRLTSRKFLLCLVVLALAIIGYLTNQLTYEQLVNIVLIAVGVFSGAEGLADAAGAFQPRPTPTTLTNITANASDSSTP